ncbi:uncharacterized protein LOC116603599 [Nematostella vectensis]|uniref:uncharacterized protein LOC116603599 n=1 Tax=Nematostella vectensis TaxID=45351 RepID=UPI002076DE5B|nr:uncharacterized protein LOC116603599 [Nematostella vectensis]
MSALVAMQTGRLAEDLATDALMKKQQLEMAKSDKAKKKRRRTSKKPVSKIVFGMKLPKWWVNLNKGVLAEFFLFLAIQGFDIFTNCLVLSEAFQTQVSLQDVKSTPNVTKLNFTVPSFCSSGVFWGRERIDDVTEHFQRVFYLYCFFLAIASMIFTLQILSWVYTLYLSAQKRELGEEGREFLVKTKLYFLLAASFFQDIPMSSITAELFALQQGNSGIVCWLCAKTGECLDEKILDSKLDASHRLIILNMAAICITSLWKGISSFYRWSRVPNFEMFYIRATTSVFAGGLFLIVILTPAMSVLTYRYYNLPGITGGIMKDLIDRVYVIGVIFWVMVLAVLFCCPLLKLIRVAS